MTKKKLFIGVLGLILLTAVVPTQFAQAEENEQPSLFDCWRSPVSCALYYVTLTINSILGILVAIAAKITAIALEFNSFVGSDENKTVQLGFNLTLALANLGFVAAIVVIAVATILRQQTYGVKQLLWKLVVAALLVNFSLTITGAILNFSDQLTTYFVNATDPTGGGAGDYLAFVGKISSSFASQGLFQPPDPDAPTWNSILPPGIDVAASIMDQFFTGILNMVFSAIFLVIIAITFLALGILLMIRYVYLSILLILMPLAWLMWIFPAFKNMWHKWWQHFLKWVFFAPIVMFFLYLALYTALNQSSWVEAHAGIIGGENDPSTTLAITTGNVGVVQSLGKIIITIGLVLGGLFAAHSLSITGATVAIGAASGIVAGTIVKSAGAGARLLGKAGEKLNVGPVDPNKATPWQDTKRGLKTLLTSKPLQTFGKKAGETKLFPHFEYEKDKKTGEMKRKFNAGALWQAASSAKGKNSLDIIVNGAKTGSGLFKKKKTLTKEQQQQLAEVGFDVEGLNEEEAEEKGGGAGKREPQKPRIEVVGGGYSIKPGDRKI